MRTFIFNYWIKIGVVQPRFEFMQMQGRDVWDAIERFKKIYDTRDYDVESITELKPA